MPIGALPPAPQRTDDPETFITKADAFVPALDVFATEANALQVDVNAKQGTASTAATTATTQAGISTTQAGIATNAAAAATATAGAVLWVSGVNYAQFAVTYSPSNAHTYRKKVVGGTLTTDPALNSTDWARLSGMATVHTDRTSNTTIVAADIGKLFRVTTGTFTQTFDLAANLGIGWYCTYTNAGSGTVTLDASGADSIGGGPTRPCYPFETLLITCDGVSLFTHVQHPFTLGVAVSGSFERPTGYEGFEVEVRGAGGGGGNGVAGSAATAKTGGSGGGGGGYSRQVFMASELPFSTTMTIGAGGTAAAAGGTTSFGALMTVNGGAAGLNGQLTSGVVAGGVGGLPSNMTTEYFKGASGGRATGDGVSQTGGGGVTNGGQGGGGGGGESAGNALSNGSPGGYKGSLEGGGAAGGVSSAGAPTAGSSGTAPITGGSGGGGGGAATTANGANGGAGGACSGGGGGGSCRTGFTPGTGGTGGSGRIIIRGA